MSFGLLFPHPWRCHAFIGFSVQNADTCGAFPASRHMPCQWVWRDPRLLPLVSLRYHHFAIDGKQQLRFSKDGTGWHEGSYSNHTILNDTRNRSPQQARPVPTGYPGVYVYNETLIFQNRPDSEAYLVKAECTPPAAAALAAPPISLLRDGLTETNFTCNHSNHKKLEKIFKVNGQSIAQILGPRNSLLRK